MEKNLRTEGQKRSTNELQWPIASWINNYTGYAGYHGNDYKKYGTPVLGPLIWLFSSVSVKNFTSLSCNNKYRKTASSGGTAHVTEVTCIVAEVTCIVTRIRFTQLANGVNAWINLEPKFYVRNNSELGNSYALFDSNALFGIKI